MRRTVSVLTLGLLLVGGHAELVLQRPYNEDELKAEFVERFAQFTQWPPGALDENGQFFVICLLGRSTVMPYLQRLSQSRRIKDRAVEFRSLDKHQQAQGCHVLWLASDLDKELEAILESISDLPILTVGDTKGYAERGVLINFRREANRVSFDINLARARRSGLRLSSRLLRLGRIVGERP